MSKRQILLDHLKLGKTRIQINTSVPGVKLPSHLMSQSAVALDLSYLFQVPMMISSNKVVATLSFQGLVFECHIPFGAIFIIKLADSVDPLDTVIFQECFPGEFLSELKFLKDIGDDKNVNLFMEDLEDQFDRDDISVSLRDTEDEKPQ